MEKWLIPALEQKNYKVNLKDHFVPESKALFKESWRLVKKIVASLKGLTLATSGQLGLKNKKNIVMDLWKTVLSKDSYNR